jgi:hypothetical protein
MAGDSGKRLQSRLRNFGLSSAAINAAWPSWWSAEADGSASAQAELTFGVARRLGLDPRSLLDERDEPRFLWRDEARFKHLAGENELERSGITSFGRTVATLLIAASPTLAVSLAGVSARDLRTQILGSGSPYVGLLDLLLLSWSIGVPVIHLRVFPWPQKRMAAMTVALGERWAVLLGKDSNYPAPVAFYLGHELGHIALGQVPMGRAIVDLEETNPRASSDDDEERSADEFALELLTGEPRPRVLPSSPGKVSARELARVATTSANALQIEPGILAQCFGYSTGLWPVATASLSHIYATAAPVWREVNSVARRELALDEVGLDAADFLDAVLGQRAAS